MEPQSAAAPAEPASAPSPARRHPAFRILNHVMDSVAWLSVAGVLVVILLQVVHREMGNPLVWTEEASRFLFMWMAFLGMAIGFRNVESARVTIFVKLCKPLCGIASAAVYTLFSGGFFLLMLYTGCQMVAQQVLFTEMASGFPLPMWAVGAIYPLAALFGLLCLIQSLLYAWDKVEVKRGDDA
ncbi:MAG: TRAP transporter small permease [Planctomycetota bacterium]|jgi:TRAP-type C4-dicarboxylate transport system permease small subunit|nr:TRAP transporter small permease [Planctomycetota bacterium]